MANWVSPRLEIRFDLSGEELQIFRRDGTRFSSYAENCQMLEEDRQRAKQERQRDQQAETRMQEMEELLRQYRARFGDLPE